MPSVDVFDTDFEGLPPFPDDDVLTVPLLRISLRRLILGDAHETERLWDACSKLGFFYLDARGASGEALDRSHISNGSKSENGETTLTDGDALIRDADRLFKVSDELFSQPVEELSKYDFAAKGSYFGYKGYGKSFVSNKGDRDRVEFYNVAKNSVLGVTEPVPQPALLDTYQPLIAEYMTNAHSIAQLILAKLNKCLSLPEGALASHHRIKKISGDQVRFCRSPPQKLDQQDISLGAHSDFGSVTILSNRLGGLQVYPPPGATDDEGNPMTGWRYVKPLPGHFIVNLGDAMVKLTGGLLKSATHRVVNPPGEEQGRLTRTSLVYFARPEDEIILKPLRGRGSKMIDDAAAKREADGEIDEEITARDWIIRRALGRRQVGSYTLKDSEGTEVTGSR